MFSVAVEKGRDAEYQKDTGNGGLFNDKKRLHMIAGAAVLVVLLVVGVLLGSSEAAPETPVAVLEPQQKPESIRHESSHTVLIQPALNMTYVMHFVKTRWPIVAAVAALLVVGIVMAVALTVLSGGSVEPPIHDPKDDIPEVVEEDETNFFLTPIGIGSLVAAAVAFVVVVLGIGRIADYVKEARQKASEDRILSGTPISEIFPIWDHHKTNISDKLHCKLICLSILGRKLRHAGCKLPALENIANPANPTFHCDANNRVCSTLQGNDGMPLKSISNIVTLCNDLSQDFAVESLARIMIGAMAKIDEARRPKISTFKKANDKMKDVGMEAGPFTAVKVAEYIQRLNTPDIF